MKLVIGYLLGAAVVGVLFFAAIGQVGHAAAEPATDAPAPQLFDGDAAHPEFWLRRSIVDCSAHTIGVDSDRVRFGLLHGLSLEQLGINNGIRPERLENGILDCESNLLAHEVAAGHITPEQARNTYAYLSNNIDRIISHHWNPCDEVLTEAAS